jgi:hypothetical protein
MNTSDFRAKATSITPKTPPTTEGSDLHLSTRNTAKNMESPHNITSAYMPIKRISNLFSMALNEARNIRNDSLSKEEMAVRFEELIDNTRLKTLIILEHLNEV